MSLFNILLFSAILTIVNLVLICKMYYSLRKEKDIFYGDTNEKINHLRREVSMQNISFEAKVKKIIQEHKAAEKPKGPPSRRKLKNEKTAK